MIDRYGPRAWVAASAGACVLGLVGSWVLLVGPTIDEATATRGQAAQVAAQNDAVRSQVASLREQFSQLASDTAELAALREQLPPEARLTELTREIADAAVATGVTVVALDVAPALELGSDPGTGLPFQDVTPATDDPSAGVDPATDPAVGDPAATDPAAAATASPDVIASPTSPPVPGMAAIPVRVTVVGPLQPVRAFLDRLQTGLARQLLVTTLHVTAREPSEGDDRRPPAAPGDVEATVGTLAYVTPSPGTVTPSEDDRPMPTMSTGNPFMPTGLGAAPAATDPATDPPGDPAADG